MRKSTKAQCVWDSGSANVLVVILLMLAQAGLECPGCTWKKYLPHRLKQIQIFFYVKSRDYVLLVRLIYKLTVDRMFRGPLNKNNGLYFWN